MAPYLHSNTPSWLTLLPNKVSAVEANMDHSIFFVDIPFISIRYLYRAIIYIYIYIYIYSILRPPMVASLIIFSPECVRISSLVILGYLSVSLSTLTSEIPHVLPLSVSCLYQYLWFISIFMSHFRQFIT
jgi:hypothetical protein